MWETAFSICRGPEEQVSRFQGSRVSKSNSKVKDAGGEETCDLRIEGLETPENLESLTLKL
jgi:hypothetical protein